jgi:galactonate dehydratase
VIDAGFEGLKFDPFAHTGYLFGDNLATNMALSAEGQDRAEAVTRAVREAIGPDIDLMVETHALLNFQTAVRMARRLAPLQMMWYEEPAGPESADTLKALRDRLPGEVAICVGERHYTRHGFRPILEQHICDIIMPDITRTGGPSEMKRIATMAEAYGVLVAPHNPNGPLSTLAAAHLCAAIPNFFRLEFMFDDVPWRDDIIDHPLDVRNGHLHLFDRPGLGVDLVEDAMEAHPGLRRAPENRTFYI